MALRMRFLGQVVQIFTIENHEFPDLLDALARAKQVGRFLKDGTVQVVHATSRLVLIASEDNQHQITISPARNFSEAERIGRSILEREEARGARVEFQIDAAIK